jgi:hypothetical protein
LWTFIDGRRGAEAGPQSGEEAHVWGEPVSELTLTVIKLGFLAMLWLLVISATSAMRAVRRPADQGRNSAAVG